MNDHFLWPSLKLAAKSPWKWLMQQKRPLQFFAALYCHSLPFESRGGIVGGEFYGTIFFGGNSILMLKHVIVFAVISHEQHCIVGVGIIPIASMGLVYFLTCIIKMNRSCRYACICIVYILYIPYLDGMGYSDRPPWIKNGRFGFPPFLSRSCRNGNSCSIPSPGSSPVKLQKAMWSRPMAARERLRWFHRENFGTLGMVP